MSRSRSLRAVRPSLLLLAALSLTGCATKKAAITTVAPLSEPAPPATTDTSKPAITLGHIGDPPYIGDAIAVHVVSNKGDQRTERTLMVVGLFEMVGSSYKFNADIKHTGQHVAVDSPLTLTLIKILDEHKAEVAHSDGSIPTEMFSHGLYSAYDTMDRILSDGGLPRELLRLEGRSGELWDRASEEDARKIVVGFASLHAMGLSLSSNKVFKKMLGDSVQRPSLVSMLFGVTIAIGTRENEVPTRTSYTLGADTLPAYIIPMVLTINDEPAMLFDLTVVPLRPPLGLCGGVVAIDARHPTKPDVNIAVRLVSASRGRPMEEIITIPATAAETPETPTSESTPKGAPVDP